ncbi:MAG: sialate O-acetylesterase [Defluviicoccus sp.]
MFESELEQHAAIGDVRVINTAEGGIAAEKRAAALDNPGRYYWDLDANKPSPLLTKAVAQMKAAGRPDGIVWAQGENDSLALGPDRPGVTVDRFVQATKKIFTYLRSELGDADLPIYIQELGSITAGAWRDYIPQIRSAQSQIAASMDKVYIAARTTDLAMVDGLHFTANSYKTIADRLADFVDDYLVATGSGGGSTQAPVATPSASSGNGAIVGTNAAERLNGTAGNDLIQGLGGDDSIYGEAGNDTFEGGAGLDYIFSGSGADVARLLRGSGVDKWMDFQDGVDKIDLNGLAFSQLSFRYDPTWNYTHIQDSSGNSMLLLKNIKVNQVTSADFIGGSSQAATAPVAGASPAVGSKGAVTGTSAADRLNGTAGNDLIQGLGGDDSMYGQAGNDTFEAGPGRDFIFSGSGADVVRLQRGSGGDKWWDFQDGVDKIDLNGLAFSQLKFRYEPIYKYTFIQDSAGADLLGLKNIVISQITDSDFI